MLEVPVDGALEAILPGGALHPAERRQLLVADEVALVVERSVLHLDDLFLRAREGRTAQRQRARQGGSPRFVLLLQVFGEQKEGK